MKTLPKTMALRDAGWSGLDSCMQHDAAHFVEFRKERYFTTHDQFYDQIKRLTKNGRREIPNPQWLVKNGFKKLCQWLERHPEVVKQYGWIRLQKTAEQYLITAQQFTKGGKLIPNSAWLQQNGHAGFDHWLRRHPEIATKYGQVRLHMHGNEKYEAEIKKLTRNGHLIPARSWLHKNGYCGLDHYLRKHPEVVKKHGQVKLDSRGNVI